MSAFDLGDSDIMDETLGAPTGRKLDPTNTGITRLEEEPDGQGADDLRAQEKTLAEELTAVKRELDQVKETSSLGKLMSIPGVREALDAHNRGESSPPNPSQTAEPAAPAEPAPVDWDQLGENPQELVRHTLERVAAVVDQVTSKRLSPLAENIKELQEYAKQKELQSAQDRLSKARAEIKDLKEWEPQMADLARVNPGLSIPELYKIAKERAGVPVTPPSGEFSEKPRRTVPTRPPRMPERPKGPGSQISRDQEFDMLLEQAAEKGTSEAIAQMGEAE